MNKKIHVLSVFALHIYCTLEFFYFLFSELVPYFQQDPASYITYRTLPDAYLEFDVDMSFRPEATDGNRFLYGSNPV